LRNIVVSFKSKHRIINKTSNKYYRFIDGVKKLDTQTKGDMLVVRKPLHKDTYFGKVNLKLIKEANIKEAEGIRAKLQAEADGKKAILLAEAEGVRAKALAEAEGIEKKAEAQKKMGEASIVEMIMTALPQVAKEVSAPLANVDNITMYGDQSTEFIENNTQKIDKVLKVAQDSLGLDLKSLVAGFAATKMLDKKED
jgi:uncharacterized membrane protein YqiK